MTSLLLCVHICECVHGAGTRQAGFLLENAYYESSMCKEAIVSFMTALGHLEQLLLCPQASIFKGLYLWKAVAQSKLLEVGDWYSQQGES